MSKEIFLKIGRAQSTKGGNRITQGSGVMIIEAIKHFVSDQSGDNFVFEFYVKESKDVPNAVDRDTGKPEHANPVGSKCSQVFQPNNPEAKSAAGNLKYLVETLDGETYANPVDFAALLGSLVNEDPADGDVNPARGYEIGYTTYIKKITKGKNAGKMGTFVNWSHIDLTAEQVQGNKNLLDGKVVA
jgi:hypothetical protein